VYINISLIIYNYIGADIKLAPKGIYMFDYIAESGKNPDPKIFEFLINQTKTKLN
jgi:hypothetical protein